ncbi:hypothetical protein D3C73_1478260 [compost metagenome]
MFGTREQNAIADPFYIASLRAPQVRSQLDGQLGEPHEFVWLLSQFLAESPSARLKLLIRVHRMHDADVQCLLGIDLFAGHHQPTGPVRAGNASQSADSS